jgi:RluA family pseudouridine synthase
VYRDAHLLVVDKPAGVAVQPGRAGTADGEDHLLARCAPLLPAVDGAPRAFRPAPAHRIDRGTSGLVVIGISGPGLRGMVEAFRERRVAKAYLAVVAREALRGREEGVVDLPLAARAARGGGRIAVVADRAEGGRQARTLWRVEAVAGALALLRVELDASGRTHQIRAHLAAVGMPLVGDRRYGGPAGPRPLLHAWRLGFVHPVPDAEGVGQQLDLVAEPPSDLRVR